MCELHGAASAAYTGKQWENKYECDIRVQSMLKVAGIYNLSK
jgi:hypothetical protein